MPDEERLRELFTEHLGIDEDLLLRDLRFDDLGVDSLDLLELLSAVEDCFDLTLDDEAFSACETLGELYDLIIGEVQA